MDPDVWMRDSRSAWEYVVIYVNDLIVAMHDPQRFFDDLQGPQVRFTMKGIGEPSYHLGADFFCDDNGTLSTNIFQTSLCQL